ncbi:SGNH/GDSL hydrolase family protein [Polyangium aurulentum]|uniref:SGNH/GDSL hydrolase family protein n=1 Tax=Polyangium aurulentum TaxID=2567896 RepID=UPI0023DEAC8A|nr:SGNH/GDSL hydrolase family protein [Polyangium aurulentum]
MNKNAIVQLSVTLGLLVASSDALANTITQNTSWTIDQSASTTKYRVVAYGDSIFAGYNGSLSSVDRRAAPMVQGEYLSNAWGTDVEVIRRTKSGAKADDIYNNKIIAERSYMQAANTRVVSFEMCGNDFLQARDAFASQSGTCSYSALDTALANCTKYQELAMQAINQYATSAKKKQIMNIYYPGYDADNALSSCTDGTGKQVNKQNAMFPRLVRSNWRACNFAAQYGFDCIDAFANFMGADYDTNGDGKIDSDGLKWVAGESEDAYVTRITNTLRSTIRDSNTHFVNSSTSYDYILSDNTHPTYSGSTISVGIFGGTGSGTGAPAYSAASGSKNSIWNLYGHERAGWAHALLNPLSP